MTTPLFDILNTTVDMARGPVDGQAPSGVRWDKNADAPTGGRTPAARQASATGAMAAAPKVGARIKQLLLWFLTKERLTIAEAGVLLEVQEKCVTGPWNKLEHTLGWIEGTREYFTYTTAGGRTVRREWHRLTETGLGVARELARQKGGR